MSRRVRFQRAPAAWLICCAAASFLAAGVCSALERELLMFMDIPVVVTASKTEQPANEAPATIDVITQQDIRDLGLRTLGDALRLVPGMDMAHVTFTEYFCARGLNNKKANSSVLCLLDGHPINDPALGTVDPLWIPLNNIERIEIIKGPGSALYGANAFTGVINLITCSAKGAAGTRVAIGGGNYGVQRQEMLVGRDLPGFSTVFSAWHYGTAAVGGHALNNNDDRDDRSFFGKVSTKGLTVSVNHYEADAGIPGNTQNSTPALRGSGLQDFFSLDYALSPADGVLIKLLTHATRMDTAIDDALLGPTEIKGGRIGAEMQFHYALSEAHSLISGIEWKEESSESRSMGGFKTIETRALYLQEEWRPLDALILTVGARYDVPSAYHSVLSPRVNLTYKYSAKTILRTSYGEAFRAPNFMEMYSDLEIGSIVHVNGNTDLLPEKINTTEASLSHAFNKDMQLSLNVFHIYASDIMYMNKVSQILPSGLLRADIGYVNEQSMEINGGEMAFVYRIDPALKTTLNYSYQDTKDLALERELQLAPAHKFGMRWDIRLGTAVRCTTYTYYVSRKTEFWSDTVAVYTEPYTVTNGRIAYELGPQAELSLAVDNLSNARYEEIPTHTFGGRTVMLDFACRF